MATNCSAFATSVTTAVEFIPLTGLVKRLVMWLLGCWAKERCCCALRLK